MLDVERWTFSALLTIRSGWVAQLVEQWTENPRVAGSIPAPARRRQKAKAEGGSNSVNLS